MLRNTLKTLLEPWGPTGNEHHVVETIKTLLAGHVDSVEVDALGNLIVEKKGTDPDGRRIMFAAHMDHIGLVVTSIEKEGFLRVMPVGGINIYRTDARHVVFENGVEGVAAIQPVKEGHPQFSDLFVDIGAKDKEEAEKMVQVGDMCVYAPTVFDMGKYRVAGPAMDNRTACALLVELLLYAENQKHTIIGVFTAQEEVGLRGATVAAYRVNPDWGLAIDVTGTADTPEVKFPAVNLGDGPAVKFVDRSMVASPVIREALFEAAEKAGVKMQREVLPYGGTDGGAIQRARAGIPTGTLSIPCRYIHSACETVDIRDMEDALKVLLQFVDL